MNIPFPAFFQDISVTTVKIAFHLSVGTIWGKQIRKKSYDFLFLFGQWAEKKLARRQIFWARIVKTANYPSKGKKCFSRLKEFLNRFRTFSRTSSAICPKVCGEVVKFEFSISIGSCQGKTYCSHEVTHFLSNSYFEWKISTLLPRNFCLICQKTAFW